MIPKSLTYIIVDLGAMLVPMLAGLDKRVYFYKYPWAVIGAILLAATPFIAADMLFTSWGVWGFTPEYVTGTYIGVLPLEEILFFICIPFSCLFTYKAFYRYEIKWISAERGKQIAWFLVMFGLTSGLIFLDKWYTGTTMLALALALFLILKFKPTFRFDIFFSAFAVLLLPFFICNGILTGTGPDQPVVWYNDLENLGVRMLTIPVEDTFYGMLLILLNCFFYDVFSGALSTKATTIK